MGIRDIVNSDGFDDNLIITQMWYTIEPPFYKRDDLDPDLVRIALDCDRVIVNIDSLERFVERYPDYRFDAKILVQSSGVRLTRRFIEHILRTNPRGSIMLLNNHGTIVECGLEIVDRICEIHPDRNEMGDDELRRMIKEGKKSVIRSMVVHGGFHYIKEIMSSSRFSHEEKKMVAQQVRKVAVPDKGDLIELLDQLGL